MITKHGNTVPFQSAGRMLEYLSLTWTRKTNRAMFVQTVSPILSLTAWIWRLGRRREDMETLQQLTVPKMVRTRRGRMM